MQGFLSTFAALLLLTATSASAETAKPNTAPVRANTVASASRTLNTVYEAAWNGVPVLGISIKAQIKPNSYVATADLSPAGITTVTSHLQKTVSYKAESRGALKPTGWAAPVHYFHRGGKKNRQVDIDFSANDVKVRVNPKFGDIGVPPTAAQRLEAIDSMAAILTLVNTAPGDVCKRSLKIFDGRTRYDVNLTPDGSETLKLADFSGTAQKCRAVYKRVAGYVRKKDQKPAFDKPLAIWFAPASNGLTAPVKIEIDSNWGPVAITLKSLTAS